METEIQKYVWSIVSTAVRKNLSQTDVSVIIVNYNVKDYLSQAIVSLQRALKKIRSEIIVVDNASDDGSVAMLRHKFPRVKLINNNQNVGFGRANNQALKIACGKYIFLLNPDTVVQENTVEVLYNFMEEHPNAGLIGCKVLNPDGTLQLPCRRSFPTPWVAFTKIVGLSKLFPSSKLFGRYNLTYLHPDKTYPVDAVSGSCMFVRREVFEQIGGFDESYYMYGEDLDYCYRVQQAGWKIYYVHSTQIIHYKGESTKRSNIDELKTFYDAMHIFVKKHFYFSSFLVFLLRLSISIVSLTASLTAFVKKYLVTLVDIVIVILSIIAGEYIRKGEIGTLPEYAYPSVYLIPSLVVVSSLVMLGVYSKRSMSITHSAIAVFISYTVLSALTAFFKEYAFSRAIIIYSGFISFVLIPGWRLLFRIARSSTENKALWRRNTVIVGTGKKAIQLAQRVHQIPGAGYDIIGYIGTNHAQIGRKLDGIPVVATIDSLSKAIKQFQITDVIFAPHSVAYMEMLALISQKEFKNITFHLVPSSMEVMVGKASIEMLNEIPLVELSYNINKSINKFSKRCFDVLVSVMLLVTVYPFFIIFKKLSGSTFIKLLPEVLSGRYSLVGKPISDGNTSEAEAEQPYLGKPGLTGLIQLLSHRTLSSKEREQYNIYYARNQSISMDIDILIRTFIKFIKEHRGK